MTHLLRNGCTNWDREGKIYSSRKRFILWQVEVDQLAGCQLPGLDCLSDSQALPILLAMDTESLLNCGRANSRLYRLVCDREVWRRLLKGIEFTKVRLEELKIFGQGVGREVKGGPEMMPEVVKEAARKLADRPTQLI